MCLGYLLLLILLSSVDDTFLQKVVVGKQQPSSPNIRQCYCMWVVALTDIFGQDLLCRFLHLAFVTDYGSSRLHCLMEPVPEFMAAMTCPLRFM